MAIREDPAEVDSLQPATDSKHASGFRRGLPQVLTVLAFGILILGVGMINAMPSVVIGALYKPHHSHSQGDTELVLTTSQASWFGSLIFMSQPVGSLFSGLLQDSIGRKRSMMAVNIPELVAWILLYTANSVTALYIAAILMGFGVGCMEAPSLCYIGEIAEPRLRGVLSTLSASFAGVGVLLESFIGAVVNWRTTCGISMSVTAIAFLCLFWLPETPAWLLYNGRVNEAEEALCWLRGWVTPKEVEKEFSALYEHIEMSNSKLEPGSKEDHRTVTSSNRNEMVPSKVIQPGTLKKVRMMLLPEVLRPLSLVVAYFFLGHCASLVGMRPYIVNIFEDFDLSMDPRWILVMSGSVQLTGGIFCMSLMKRLGKRTLTFISLSTCVICCLLLAGYTHFAFHTQWLLLTIICSVYFFTGLGIGAVPWALLSEIFPLKARGLGGGMSAAACYASMFVLSKSYLDLISISSFSCVLLLYATVGTIGIVYLYYALPETEGKTLPEIEFYFKKCTMENK